MTIRFIVPIAAKGPGVGITMAWVVIKPMDKAVTGVMKLYHLRVPRTGS